MSKEVKVDAGMTEYLNGFTAGMKKMDGWMNVISGINTTKDARMYSEVRWELLQELDAENMYGGDAMAAKVVNIVPEEATKKGYSIIGLSEEDRDKLSARAKEINLDACAKHAWEQARLYGGCGLMKIYDDDMMLNKPRTPGARITGLIPFHRWILIGQWEDLNKDILSPNFNQPLIYTFMPRGAAIDAGMMLLKINATRVTRFDGLWLPERLRQTNGYWGDSVLGRLNHAIRNFSVAHDSANSALKDLSVAVFKMKGLADQITADGGEKNVVLRMEMVNLCKSIARAVIVDSDGEEFDYQSRNVSGVKDLVTAAEDYLVANANIPKTVLLGQSPQGGLGQSGDSESENWYSFIEGEQKNYLGPKLLEIYRELGEELGINTAMMDLKFTSLWSEDAKTAADTRLVTAQTDNIYQQMGALDATEIRTSRFGPGGYSAETTVDDDMDDELGLSGDPGERPAGMSGGPSGDNIQQQALNGLQIQNMVAIVEAVAAKTLPLQSGIRILMRAFQLSEEEATAIMADAGTSFEPAKPEPAPVQPGLKPLSVPVKPIVPEKPE